MIWISKQKFFNRYLPMFLSVVLIVAAGFVYLIYYNPQTALAAIAFVRDNTAAASNVITITAPTVGDTMVCTAMVNSAGSTVTSVSATNIAFAQAGNSNTNESVEVWYGTVNASPGTSITFNWSAGSTFATACAEFSGVASVGVVDGTKITANGTTFPAATGSYSNANAYDIIVAGIGVAGSTVPTAVSPYVGLNGSGSGSGGNAHSVMQSYNIVHGKAAQSTSFAGGSGNWDSVIIGLEGNDNPPPTDVNIRGGFKARGGVKFR